MNKIGIIGGIGPASTIDYYTDVIKIYRERTQSDEYPGIIIESINMTEMLGYVSANNTEKLVKLLVNSIENVALAGADIAAIASNTPHIVFDEVKRQSPLPLISIVDETCKTAFDKNCKIVIVIGTKFTMSSGLYAKAFAKYNIEAIVPTEEEQSIIHNIIFPNLENGIVLPDEKLKMIEISQRMITENNADALVLGCTELPLMINQDDLHTTILNTTKIHIESIVEKLI